MGFFKELLISIWGKSKKGQVCCNILKHSGSMQGRSGEVKTWQGQAGDWARGALPGGGRDAGPKDRKRSTTSVWVLSTSGVV